MGNKQTLFHTEFLHFSKTVEEKGKPLTIDDIDLFELVILGNQYPYLIDKWSSKCKRSDISKSTRNKDLMSLKFIV